MGATPSLPIILEKLGKTNVATNVKTNAYLQNSWNNYMAQKIYDKNGFVTILMDQGTNDLQNRKKYIQKNSLWDF